MKMVHGKPHGGEPQYFVGCGWSNWFTLDVPCLSGELDDQVFFLQDTFDYGLFDAVAGDDEEPQWALSRLDQESDLPLCRADIEWDGGHSQGRWVQEDWPDDN